MLSALLVASLISTPSGASPADGPAIATKSVVVDGLSLHYLEAGKGPAVILLHGYTQTSRMWRPLMSQLATDHRVVAPDLPGIGESAVPADGLDMASAAMRIHGLAQQLGIEHAVVVGHDIGLMVAYAYAAQHPGEVEKLALMDAFLPGVEGWEAIYNNPTIWHFRFTGSTPEALVKGRERTYYEHYWNDFAADPKRSLSEADRQFYTAAYARPGRMRAGWAYFISFPKTATDFAQLARTKLPMPVLTIGGAKANGAALAAQGKLVATNATSIVLANTGHWLMEENPRETMEALSGFIRGKGSATSGQP